MNSAAPFRRDTKKETPREGGYNVVADGVNNETTRDQDKATRRCVGFVPGGWVSLSVCCLVCHEFCTRKSQKRLDVRF